MFKFGDKVKVVSSGIFCGQEGIVVESKDKYSLVLLGSIKSKFSNISLEKIFKAA